MIESHSVGLLKIITQNSFAVLCVLYFLMRPHLSSHGSTLSKKILIIHVL